MARIFTVDDIDPNVILNLRVAVIGYGNQGRPQALNLRDSGINVHVGMYRESTKWNVAVSDGLEVLTTSEAANRADLVMLTLPDTKMAAIYRTEIEPHLKSNSCVLFSHGFNVHFGLIQPRADLDIALLAPKGAGTGVRNQFVAGTGVPGLVAVHQDASGTALKKALSYGWGIGCAKSFMMATTFAEETETDLFGEQAVLCGGIPELIRAGFETLVAAGYQPEVAYFECVHETKLIVDLIVERGLAGMRDAISETAEWGGQVIGPRLVNGQARIEMENVLAEIRSGKFAREWVREAEDDAPHLQSSRKALFDSEIERIGRDVRARIVESVSREGNTT